MKSIDLNKILIIFLTIPLFCVFCFTGCDKDSQHPVPEVYVDFKINLELPSNHKLTNVNGREYYTGGYKGIIIYRLSEEEFRAFDRACTYNISERIISEDPPIAECEDCESSYLLLDGSVVEGPAKHHLKEYRVVFEYPFVYVSN